MQDASFQYKTPKKIFIIAGEASGDLHGAHLVKNLLSLCPDLSIYGIGGEGMAKAGMEIVFHTSEIAVMGIIEVLSHLRKIYKIFKSIKHSFDDSPPDLIILIDFPDFNLRVAKEAAKRGIPVVYYISPQIWAWRRNRVQQIASRVTQMLVIFPFEERFYIRHGIPAKYVGHPLLDQFSQPGAEVDTLAVCREMGLSSLYPIVGLFPGSRVSEVRALLPVFLRASQALYQRFPRMQFFLGKAPGLKDEFYRPFLKDVQFPITSIHSGIGPAMNVCDLALVASGTATLELAILGMPMIVAYKVSPITFGLARLLVRVPAISMVNIISQKTIIPELLQNDFNEKNLYDLCWLFFTESTYYSQVKNELAGIKKLLGRTGASEKAAQTILEMLS